MAVYCLLICRGQSYNGSNIKYQFLVIKINLKFKQSYNGSLCNNYKSHVRYIYSNNLHLHFHKRIAASFRCIIIAISFRIGKLASFIRLLDHIVSRVLAEHKFTEPCVGRRDLDAAKMRVFLSLRIEKALPRQPVRLGIFRKGRKR
jgi:hypothetical protein